METQAVPPPKPKQPLVARLGFFVLGGVASTFINKNLLDIGQSHLHLNHVGAYAFSSGTTAVIFFLWSYFVNFRTSAVWKDCLFRYIAAFVLALLVNNLIAVPILARYGHSGSMKYLIIGAVQSFTGGIKFLLYHFWVFPHAETAKKSGSAEPASIS